MAKKTITAAGKAATDTVLNLANPGFSTAKTLAVINNSDATMQFNIQRDAAVTLTEVHASGNANFNTVLPRNAPQSLGAKSFKTYLVTKTVTSSSTTDRVFITAASFSTAHGTSAQSGEDFYLMLLQ